MQRDEKKVFKLITANAFVSNHCFKKKTQTDDFKMMAEDFRYTFHTVMRSCTYHNSETTELYKHKVPTCCGDGVKSNESKEANSRAAQNTPWKNVNENDGK